MTSPIVALTIAGLDPTGGAGLAADLRTFDAFGVHGAAVATTLTAQNTSTFVSSFPTDTELLASQLDLVCADLDVAAVKIGMVPTAEILDLLSSFATRFQRLVLDPVAVDRHGYALSGSAERDAILSGLLPQCEIVTPNRAELAWLVDEELASENDVSAIERQAVALRALGAPWVAVTGGRIGTTEAIDVLVGPDVMTSWVEPRLVSRNDRGSGCTFSAAITAGFAGGSSVEHAVGQAHSFVQRALRGALDWQIGAGTGPLAQRLAGRGSVRGRA